MGVIRSSRTIPLVTTFLTPPPVTGLILDTYAGGTLAYSFRKLRTAYAGSAVRIRRESDEAEADIGFSGDDFDTAAAATHIGGSTGHIVTWYNQGSAGSTGDVTQATTFKQPFYRASTILSQPSIEFTTAQPEHLLTSTSIASSVFTNNATTTAFWVAQNNSADANGDIFGWDFNGARSDCFVGDYTTTELRLMFGNATTGLTGGTRPTDDVPHLIQVYRNLANTQENLADNISLVSATKTAVTAAHTAPFYIGGEQANNSNMFKGFITELIIWADDIGAGSRAAAQTNINSYYSVF